MPKDRDQLTPDEPEDWSRLQTNRGQGTGGTGYDRLPGAEAPASMHDEDSTAETVPEPLPPNADEGGGER
jgi:hypothetical protein